MLDSKFKKEIGFIKNPSSTKNLHNKAMASSSDSFSSFEYEGQHKKEEFSPYRHPPSKIVSKRLAGSEKGKQEKERKIEKKDSGHPRFSNLMLRNNFINEQKPQYRVSISQAAERNSLTDELQDINKHIKDVRAKFENVQQEYERESEEDRKETPTLIGQPNASVAGQEEEEELSMSNINRFKDNKEYISSPLPQEEEQNYPKTLAQYRKYLEESSDEEEEELKEKKTMKSKHKPHRKEPEEEELIVEWDKQEFKDKSMKTAILEHDRQNPRPKAHAHKQKGLVESRGGVCFEVDTKQFKAAP
jgi:hypothetical protein